MSQHENPSSVPSQPSNEPQPPAGYQPDGSPAQSGYQPGGAPAQSGYQPGGAPAQSGYQPGGVSAPSGYQPPQQSAMSGPPQPNPPKARNVLGLIALIVAVVGFIFACVPGALVVGWVLLPIAFILAIVSFFQRGKGKGLGIAALIVSVVGTIVGVIVFMAVIATSFEQAFNEGTEVVADSSDAEAPEEEAADPAQEAEPAGEAASEAGSRGNPLPVGTTVSSDEWTVTIESINTDGNPVVAASPYNDAPVAGSHYEVVTYTVTYTGDESDYAAMVGVDAVTSSGNVINSYDNLVILEDAMGADELFNGASATGSVAFLVPDGETTLVRVRPGVFADEVFVQP